MDFEQGDGGYFLDFESFFKFVENTAISYIKE
jgi:hypothetical protein